MAGSSYLISISLWRVRDKGPGESLSKGATSSQLDGGSKPAVLKQKKVRQGNLHILFIPPQHRHLAKEEHNGLLIIFPIPMGMKFIPLEEH